MASNLTAQAASGSKRPHSDDLAASGDSMDLEEVTTAYGYPQLQYTSGPGLHTQFTSGVYTMAAYRCDQQGLIDSKISMSGLSFPAGTTVEVAGRRVQAALRKVGIPTSSLPLDLYITRQPGKGAKQAGSCALLQFSNSEIPSKLLAGEYQPILPVVGKDSRETIQGIPLMLKYPGDSTVAKADRKACRVEVHRDVFRGLDANQVNYIIISVGKQLAEKEGATAVSGLQFQPGLTSKAMESSSAVIAAVNPFSASFMPTTKWGAAAGQFGEGYLQADLPMFSERVLLRFTKVQGVQVAGWQVVMKAHYLGVYLAALRGKSVYRNLGSRIPSVQEQQALQADLAAHIKQPLPQPAVQVVPLKPSTGTVAHLLVSVPSKQWVKKLVEQGLVLSSRGGIYLGFEEPKLARK